MRLASVEKPDFDTFRSRWREIVRVTVRLATPMLGGGSIAGQPDADQPFRPSAIRGALRHWWRASNAFASPEEMKERERALWGMADASGAKSSRVRIEVDSSQASGAEIRRQQARDLPAYAQGILIEPDHGPNEVLDADAMRITRSGSFALCIGVREEVDSLEEERLILALSAWLLFGGLGARTRRGFGTLVWEGFDPRTSFPGDPLAEPVSGFTSLLGARLFLFRPQNGSRFTEAEAWSKAIETLRDFRKGQLPGKDRPAGGIQSHSPWPEADSIRDAQRVGPLRPLPNGRQFPRAELGMPLQFRSAKPGRQNDFQPVAGEFHAEWAPTTDGGHRLASPVIAKPIRWDEQWHAGLLLMHRGRISRRGIPTDCSGYPHDIHGHASFSGAKHQPRESDIVQVFAKLLPIAYGYAPVVIG